LAGVPIRLTGHSLRAGLATEARRARHDRKTISSITGHSPTSATLEGYFREIDEWRDAPGDIL
jgi:integrase